MKNRLVATLAAAAAFALASPAQSSVVIDTFGPGNTYETEWAWFVGKTDIDHGTVSALFTLTADGIVDDVAVAAIAKNFTLAITADDAGVPGSVLATISAGFTVDGYIEFHPSVALSAGTYWLQMAAPGDALFTGGWYPNSESLGGYVYQFVQSVDDDEPLVWSGFDGWTYPALRIGVSEARAVPEPGTFALLGAGIALAGLMRRRGRAAPAARS